MKEAFYFPHFIGARNDRKIKRVRRDLGAEGYALYFMTLEVLREEQELAYPMEDIDILADDFGTSEAKLKTIVLNYDLFSIRETTDGHMFFSPKQIQYLEPYFNRRETNRLKGLKSGISRRQKAEQLVLKLSDIDSTEAQFNNGSTSVELRKNERTKEKIKLNPIEGTGIGKIKLNLSREADEYRQKLLNSGYVGHLAPVMVEQQREDVFINEQGLLYTSSRTHKQIVSSTLNEIWEQLTEINEMLNHKKSNPIENLKIQKIGA